jgi:hypothetical protein
MSTKQVFVEWMRRQGHHVLKTESSYWTDSGMGTYQSIPYHDVISPSEEEIQAFFGEYCAIAIRYSTPVNAPAGSFSYHVMYERGEYSQKDLPKKARYDVKKGLSVAAIEPISLARLKAEGWEIRHDTLQRQGRSGAESKSWWERLCKSADGLEGFEAWGAKIDGRLTAALLGFLCDDYYCILYQQSLSEYLRFGVNNALTYVVTCEVLGRPEVKRIFYGLHSLDAPTSVDEFKFRMGFQAKPLRQRIMFSPCIKPFVNELSHKLLQLGHRMIPKNHTLSKAEGVFRFYLNGNLPISKQTIPKPLISREPDQMN